MVMKINKNESLENREAFEYYYSLGNSRALSTVAERFGKSALTVKRWSKSFNWQDRVKIRDIDIGEKVERATNAHVVASRAMYRETIGFLVEQFRQDVMDKKITITKIEDFIKIANLDMELAGVGGEANGDSDNMKSLAAILDHSAKLVAQSLHGQPAADDTDDAGPLN